MNYYFHLSFILSLYPWWYTVDCLDFLYQSLALTCPHKCGTTLLSFAIFNIWNIIWRITFEHEPSTQKCLYELKRFPFRFFFRNEMWRCCVVIINSIAVSNYMAFFAWNVNFRSERWQGHCHRSDTRGNQKASRVRESSDLKDLSWLPALPSEWRGKTRLSNPVNVVSQD